MRTLFAVALFVVSSVSFSGGQQVSTSAPSSLPDAQPAPVKVYAVGPGVTAPEFVPLSLAPISAGKCKKKLDGMAALSFLVDTTGHPRNIMFLRPLGNNLDKLALQIVDADLFNPGTHDGTPVVVGLSVEVGLQACVEGTKDGEGKSASQVLLRSHPTQKFGMLPPPQEDVVLKAGAPSLENSISRFPNVYHVGDGVTAPVVIHFAQAEFSDEARREKYDGVCMLSLIVDTKGMPQFVRVERPLGHGLDEKAIEAVNQYRFKPAMKDGQPVAVILAVEVAFHLYNR
ncbi:MAG: energy transducer TonB [Terracidiphilus sp.]|jgi:TonB family protein